LRPLGLSGGGYNSESSGTSRYNYEQAKQEYEVALAAYEAALKELNDIEDMERNSRFLMGGTKAAQALGAIGSMTSGLTRNDAVRKVKIARERLERAKVRLDR
jgi:hypothetical protein